MITKKTGLIALLTSFALSGFCSNTLTNYTVGDVLVCFRGGTYDLVVDAGPVSTFTNYAPNTTNIITAYAASQLSSVGTNNVNWSAFTFFDSTVSPNYTLFATRARSSLNTQSTPWPTAASSSQSLCAGDMTAIVRGANDNLNFSGANTSTAVIEQDSSQGNGNYPTGLSYHDTIDPDGTGLDNFGGDFAGNPEQTTAANFTSAGVPVRADFYQIPPTGSGSTRYLGYFELSTKGVLSYVAYPTAIPVVNNLSRSVSISTISYKTGTYGTYTLRGTNNIAAPLSTWPAITTLSSGDAKSHTYQDTDSSSYKFYIITGQ